MQIYCLVIIAGALITIHSTVWVLQGLSGTIFDVLRQSDSQATSFVPQAISGDLNYFEHCI